MTIRYHNEVMQGTDEWMELRRGILTASEMRLIITPTLKCADNDKSRSHLYELLAQRISSFVEPHYLSDDMLRGQEDEIYARDHYSENYAPVRITGFVTNDEWGFTLGFSPDGLVGDDGLIECKSRRQKYHIETILSGCMPSEFLVQVQTGLLVTRRKWCDFISYCGGLPMFTHRVYSDADVQTIILAAAEKFYRSLDEKEQAFGAIATDCGMRLLPTKRIIHEEIYA